MENIRQRTGRLNGLRGSSLMNKSTAPGAVSENTPPDCGRKLRPSCLPSVTGKKSHVYFQPYAAGATVSISQHKAEALQSMLLPMTTGLRIIAIMRCPNSQSRGGGGGGEVCFCFCHFDCMIALCISTIQYCQCVMGGF